LTVVRPVVFTPKYGRQLNGPSQTGAREGGVVERRRIGRQAIMPDHSTDPSARRLLVRPMQPNNMAGAKPRQQQNNKLGVDSLSYTYYKNCDVTIPSPSCAAFDLVDILRY